MKKITKKSNNGKVDIYLETPHTHAGVNYVQGDKITVNQSQADRLEEDRIGFRKRPFTSDGEKDIILGVEPDEI